MVVLEWCIYWTFKRMLSFKRLGDCFPSKNSRKVACCTNILKFYFRAFWGIRSGTCSVVHQGSGLSGSRNIHLVLYAVHSCLHGHSRNCSGRQKTGDNCMLLSLIPLEYIMHCVNWPFFTHSKRSLKLDPKKIPYWWRDCLEITVMSLIGQLRTRENSKLRNNQSETRCNPVRATSSIRNFSGRRPSASREGKNLEHGEY